MSQNKAQDAAHAADALRLATRVALVDAAGVQEDSLLVVPSSRRRRGGETTTERNGTPPARAGSMVFVGVAIGNSGWSTKDVFGVSARSSSHLRPLLLFEFNHAPPCSTPQLH